MHHKSEGFLLLSVLYLFTISTLLLAVSLSRSLTEMRASDLATSRERAFGLAEGVVDEAIHDIWLGQFTTALNPDIPNKVAFIDLGSRERITPGLKFLVAEKGPQGKFQYKGKILVKKVWMTYAEVAITDIYDRDVPIVDGDLIVNPLFNARRPVVVAFLGETESGRLRPNWSTNEAGRRIVEIGSEVRSRLTLDVDFVIFTWAKKDAMRDNDEGYKLAVLLGVPIEEASDLYRFLED
jgi:hypothetical protein